MKILSIFAILLLVNVASAQIDIFRTLFFNREISDEDTGTYVGRRSYRGRDCDCDNREYRKEVHNGRRSHDDYDYYNCDCERENRRGGYNKRRNYDDYDYNNRRNYDTQRRRNNDGT